MIDEIQLLSDLKRLHKAATETMMEKHSKDGTGYVYFGGIADGICSSMETIKRLTRTNSKLATVPPQAEGETSENQHREQ